MEERGREGKGEEGGRGETLCLLMDHGVEER